VINDTTVMSVAEKFKIDGKVIGCCPIKAGHINRTFLVEVENDNGEISRYVMQQINDNVFKKPLEVMENMKNVTDFLKKKIISAGGDPVRETLCLVDSLHGDCYYIDENGKYWRMYCYIDKVHSYHIVENPQIFENAGWAFGNFQYQLRDFPAETLHETIEKFHDTTSRYANLMEAVKNNYSGRLSEVQPEIDFVQAREGICSFITDGIACGKFPLRVTHNDTKLNNILMDECTGEGLCVIDLDTVMPGSLLFDFGDAIRFGASSAAEDEQDLDKVYMRLDLFQAFARGFINGTRGALNEHELRALPMSAIVITFEIGLRFLTDHIDGDKYFAIHREGHNLDRARTQFKLVSDMEKKLPEMQAAVERLIAENSGK